MADNKNTSIKNLPQVEEIKAGDFLLVEADNGTSIIDFEDFVLGDNNTTHGFQISGLQTDITGLSSSIDSVSGSINPIKTDVATISADIKKGINQVVSTVKRDTFSVTSNETTFSVIEGLSAAITPTKTNSVIHINVCVHHSCVSEATNGFLIVKNNFDRFIEADDLSNRPGVTFRDTVNSAADSNLVSFTCIDHPGSTDEQTYGIAFANHSGNDIHINRSHTHSDSNNMDSSVAVSTYTVMEIITG